MMSGRLTPTDVKTLEWIGDTDGHLRLIDQTLLPVQVAYVDCRDLEMVWEAIRSLRVRGAPAIGIAAAYGVVLASQKKAGQETQSFVACVNEAASYLATSRPTAVNLFWALDRMKATAQFAARTAAPSDHLLMLLKEARSIENEDKRACREMGRHGAELLADGQGVLTHCNAGGLATSEYGTALAMIYAAHDAGKSVHVFADETRPLLQGARLTAWELQQHGIDVTVICDSTAAQVMREGRVHAVVTGADRIAANGDTANKIGTYSLAILARAHNIPFYVVAPTSTFDLTLRSGDSIPIESRAAEEVSHGFGKKTVPDGVSIYNPAFDVTPASLIHAIVCEWGIIRPVTAKAIAQMVGENQRTG